jgi:endonuclease YncB( thermonuclease family)
MRRLPLLLVPLVALCVASTARADFVSGELILDGSRISVSWNDGDSFRVSDGALKKTRARLADVNALENYGPVHRWGGWNRWELYSLSQQSARVCVSQAWTCTTLAAPDRYGRKLVRCPALARELVKLGQAMVFAVDEPARPELVLAQKDAQRRGAGMWNKGVPSRLISGAHSALEFDGGKGYDRIVDTATGKAEAVPHSRAYETCEDVCVGEGKDESCLVYVPFKRRYHEPPPCLTNPRIEPRPAQKRAPSSAR